MQTFTVPAFVFENCFMVSSTCIFGLKQALEIAVCGFFLCRMSAMKVVLNVWLRVKFVYIFVGDAWH